MVRHAKGGILHPSPHGRRPKLEKPDVQDFLSTPWAFSQGGVGLFFSNHLNAEPIGICDKIKAWLALGQPFQGSQFQPHLGVSLV